jgi:hypothetical protein
MFSYPAIFLQTPAPEAPGKPFQWRLAGIGWCSRLPQSPLSANSKDRFFSLDAAAKILDSDCSSIPPSGGSVEPDVCVQPCGCVANLLTSLFSQSIQAHALLCRPRVPFRPRKNSQIRICRGIGLEYLRHPTDFGCRRGRTRHLHAVARSALAECRSSPRRLRLLPEGSGTSNLSHDTGNPRHRYRRDAPGFPGSTCQIDW